MPPLKKMNLGASLDRAQQHSKEQRVTLAAPHRMNKADLADRSDAAHPRATRPATSKAKPKPPRRVKSIREIFTYSSEDAERLQQVIKRAGRTGVVSNKSEVVRAGIIGLNKMTDEQLAKTLKEVIRLMPGRPKQGSGQRSS
jgi:hypothetical protein